MSSVSLRRVAMYAPVCLAIALELPLASAFFFLETQSVLLRLEDTNTCLSANSVWQYLDDLQVRNPSCRKYIQKQLADKYNQNANFVDDCTCNAKSTLVNHEIHRMENASYLQCMLYSREYKTIEADLLSNIRAHGCRNHAYLWEHLEKVTDNCHSGASNNHHSACNDCQQDLIVRAATFVAPPTTQLPKSTPTIRHTTKAPTTTSRASVTTSPYVSQRKFVCDEISVVELIAQGTQTTHAAASLCDPNNGGSDDAYVLASCNMTSPMTWKRGKNVMEDCKSGQNLIPGFTPIATFKHGSFASTGSQSGVFLECYHSGLKMAIQKCNSAPGIVHIESGGVFNNNPDNYYVIV